ncbi:MAG: extracellular solute-binding protein [Bryobacteraceae bacterium]
MSRPESFRIAVRKFGPFESAIAKQWAAFDAEANTGLRLEAVPMDLHPLGESLASDDWDVHFVNTDWIASLAASRRVLDLAPMLAADPPSQYPDGWAPSLLRLHTVEGAVLGLPYHDGPECLIFRKDLFEEARLRVPQTWAEFHQVARLLHSPQQGLSGTVFAAFPDGHNTVYDFCLQLWTRGGELFDAAGVLRLDTPQAAEGLAFYRQIVNDSRAVHPLARDFDSVKSGLAFAAGEVAMMVNWFGFAAMAETMEGSRVSGKVDIAPIPGRCASLNVYWVLSIAAASAHPDVAWRFLRHCASPQMDKLLTLEGAIGCRRSTWADAEVNRVVPFYHKLAALHDNAREMPRLAAWPRIAEVIDQAVLGAINTATPIEELLRTAQARLDQLEVA